MSSSQKTDSRTAGAPSSPLISLIIPSYRRRSKLLKCLASLSLQTYPRDCWEVVVVLDDDDPVDPTLSEWSGMLALRFIRQPHSGCAMARNAGSAEALGTHLVFTDDDCSFPPDWLFRYAEHFQRTPECLIAGRTANSFPYNLYSRAGQVLLDYLFMYFNSRSADAELAVGCNFGVPADGFCALGGFSRRYYQVAGAEDRDFACRWRQQGRRIVFAPDVIVYHAHRLTLASFIRQHFNYGRGAWRLHSDSTQGPQVHFPLEDCSFYLSLLERPFVVSEGLSALRLFLVLAISQAAHTLGYLCESMAGVRRKGQGGE